MTQAQLNRAVANATGEDCERIDRMGFSLVEEDVPQQDDDLEALMVDWDQLRLEQTTALFRDRQQRQDP